MSQTEIVIFITEIMKPRQGKTKCLPQGHMAMSSNLFSSFLTLASYGALWEGDSSMKGLGSVESWCMQTRHQCQSHLASSQAVLPLNHCTSVK